MKTLMLLIMMMVFATTSNAEWKPSAEEIQLSAREDARDAALFELLAK